MSTLEPPLSARDKPMAEALRAFLAQRTPDSVEPMVFGEHVMQMRGYLTPDAPPAEFVLAGRAVVRRGDQVLVLRNGGGQHVLPGGRLEPGEDAAAAAKREVLEEAGWEVGDLRPLAFAHIYNEGPKPTNVGRVIYPDFVWQIFEAAPLRHRPEAKLEDDYELGGVLKPLAEAERLVRYRLERALLAALGRS